MGERTNWIQWERATHCFKLIPTVALSGLVVFKIFEENINWEKFELYLENMLVSYFTCLHYHFTFNWLLINPSICLWWNISQGLKLRWLYMMFPFTTMARLQSWSNNVGVYYSICHHIHQTWTPWRRGSPYSKRNGNLIGGQDDSEKIQIYAELVFTPEIMKSLFFGLEYMG